MRDLEKSGHVKWLCEVITNAVTSYENDKHPIYFDYDGAIGLLEQAQTTITESARCPRPADLPPELPWCERLYNGDEVFDPYTYGGDMTYEDYQSAAAASFEDDRLDGESEEFEI